MAVRFVLAATMLAGAGLIAAAPALACSVGSDYRLPTGLELAAEADAIVVATVTGEHRADGASLGTVTATPTLALKGRVLSRAIELSGSAIFDDPRVLITLSDPRELRSANRDAFAGGCVRYLFRPGMQLALFLKRDETGAWRPIRHPFSRDAEDVAGPNALWVRAVREYVAISAQPRAAWPEALRRRAAALRATGIADAALIAADMDIERSVPRRAFLEGRRAAARP